MLVQEVKHRGKENDSTNKINLIMKKLVPNFKLGTQRDLFKERKICTSNLETEIGQRRFLLSNINPFLPV